MDKNLWGQVRINEDLDMHCPMKNALCCKFDVYIVVLMGCGCSIIYNFDFNYIFSVCVYERKQEREKMREYGMTSG